jgi:hypothetical protein
MSYDLPGSVNPFEAPRAQIRAGAGDLEQGDMAGYELTRRTYLNHEASVKAVGGLQYFGAFLCLLGMVFFFTAAAGVISGMTQQPGIAPEQMGILNAVLGVFCLIGFLLYGGWGYGLRHLHVWARWVTIVLTSLSLLLNLGQVVLASVANPQAGGAVFGVVAIPSLITAYILYLVASAKGAVVFSREYKEVIRRTPHIKYKTSIIVKILLVFLVVVILLGLSGFLYSLATRK